MKTTLKQDSVTFLAVIALAFAFLATPLQKVQAGFDGYAAFPLPDKPSPVADDYTPPGPAPEPQPEPNPQPQPEPQQPPSPQPEPAHSGSAACDDFTGGMLSKGWQWIDPKGDSDYDLQQPGFLKVTVNGRDHDLYQNMNAPRLLQPVSGDFVAETNVSLSPTRNYQGAGLLYWQDENNFVRLERTLVQGIDLLYKIQGIYQAVEIPFSNPDVYLKFELKGQTLQGFYSVDRSNWQGLQLLTLPPSNNQQVGLVVINEWQDGSLTATFDYFKVGNCQ